jgi:flagellar motor protein MotB
MALRLKTTAGPSANTWMLSFIDLVTLMLTFFVLIFATQKPNDMAWQQTQQGFQQAFKGLGGEKNDVLPPKVTEQDDVAKQLADDSHMGLDIDYLSGLLTKAWAQDTTLAAIPFELITAPQAVHIRLLAAYWQTPDLAQALAPLLNRLDNDVHIMAQSAQQDTSLMQAQQAAQLLKAAGYQRNISALAQLNQNQDFIDVVLTFNVH